jgi:glutathione peroxidase-family protein
MKMKKSILKIATLSTVVALFLACKGDVAKVSGRFVGLNFKTVYLEQMTASGQHIVDSVELDKDGGYRFVVKDLGHTPSLYNIMYGGDRIPLLLSRGERVDVSAMGSALANYTVEGSEESVLLRKFNKEYIEGQLALNKTTQSYHSAEDDARKRELAQSYVNIYNSIKRKQISFIIEHKSSLAAVYALYQRLPGDPYLAGADSDLIYYRTVSDAVSKRYPLSPFLLTLSNDIARMEARISLINSIEFRNSPELKGRDMYGNEVALSSFSGDVVLVDFWSAEAGNSNALNADLKEIYEKYYSKGFRVYQVSADTSKVAWITAVQEQRLPWVSVCDFKGQYSPMLRTYNVRKLPSNYLIDREGKIVAKDVYSDALVEKLKSLLE